MILTRMHNVLSTCAVFCGAVFLSPQSDELAVPAVQLASQAVAEQLAHVVGEPAVLLPSFAAAQSDQLFATPSVGMLIRGGAEGAQSLRAFLRDFGSLTGETFIFDEETAQLLESKNAGLDHDITVAPEDMYSVMQALLVQSRFALVDVRRAEPRLLKVVSLDTRSGQLIRSSARFVPEGELAAFSKNSALFVTTSLVLPNLNESEVVNRMRNLVVDNNLERILTVSGTKQIVLTGLAGQVGEWAELLRDMNRNTVPVEPE